MRQIALTAAALAAISSLSACNAPPKASADNAAPDYEIIKSGIVKEEDKHVYESLGDTTFTRTQTYKVRRVTKGKEKDSTVLFLRQVLKVGNKDVSDEVTIVVMDKGEGELTCFKSYDVKTINYDTTPDPVCTYTTVGEMPLAPAKVVFK